MFLAGGAFETTADEVEGGLVGVVVLFYREAWRSVVVEPDA